MLKAVLAPLLLITAMGSIVLYKSSITPEPPRCAALMAGDCRASEPGR